MIHDCEWSAKQSTTGFAKGTQFILGQIHATLKWQCICEVMERQRSECTTCGRFTSILTMIICRISKGGDNLFVFVGGMSPGPSTCQRKYGYAVSSLRKLSSRGYRTPTVVLLSSCRRPTNTAGAKTACPSGMVVRWADTGGGFFLPARALSGARGTCQLHR
jgi:hypothetical protein